MSEEAFENARRRIITAHRRQQKSLDLSDKQLSALPSEIRQLTGLQFLDLSNNQLTALPPEIGQLASLQSLDLSNNQLTALPPEIGQLASLQSLDLSYNKITTLPAEVARLTALRFLNFDGNQLSNLPLGVGKLIAVLNRAKSKRHKVESADSGFLSTSHLEKFQIVVGIIVSIATMLIGWKTYELSEQSSENNVQLKRIEQQISENRFGFERVRDIYDRTEKYLASPQQDEKRGRALVALINSLPHSTIRSDMLAIIVHEATPNSVAASAADLQLGKTPLDKNVSITVTTLDPKSFFGKVMLSIDQESYKVVTLESFQFKDSEGTIWEVHKGEVFAGDAIPRTLWSVVGSPFNGNYIAAMIVFERYVNLRTYPWDKTIRMFHEALVKSGMSEAKAMILYTAIKQFGPRWEVVTK
jgi:hypothetical protein